MDELTRTSAAAPAMSRTRFLVQAALIGAVYAALTMALAPLSYGPVQMRVSEALTVLPYFTPAAIPGLFVGCFLANLISPVGAVDVVCGSLATLLAACASYGLRKWRFLTPLPPVLFNAVIIGTMLYYVYDVDLSLPLNMAWVGLGQLVACYVLGYPLLRLLEKHRRIFR
ncbi:MAG: QueT transporter family protein [Clostridiales Family XIII bacterium]|nr:QueT transporter family protein [Clostridiales Family XIII bacterium]